MGLGTAAGARELSTLRLGGKVTKEGAIRVGVALPGVIVTFGGTLGVVTLEGVTIAVGTLEEVVLEGVQLE